MSDDRLVYILRPISATIRTTFHETLLSEMSQSRLTIHFIANYTRFFQFRSYSHMSQGRYRFTRHGWRGKRQRGAISLRWAVVRDGLVCERVNVCILFLCDVRYNNMYCFSDSFFRLCVPFSACRTPVSAILQPICH